MRLRPRVALFLKHMEPATVALTYSPGTRVERRKLAWAM